MTDEHTPTLHKHAYSSWIECSCGWLSKAAWNPHPHWEKHAARTQQPANGAHK